tara:strand:- start:6 stop:356 length:351 start_codon:yes stop_codon:yes gene_type:complete
MVDANVNEDALYNSMKDLPDFDCMPIPVSWFKKYNIPPRSAVNPKDFMESNYTLLKSIEKKDLPPIIIDEPQRNGELVEVPAEDPVEVEVKCRPFEWDTTKPFPAVLPSLAEIKED